MPQSASSMLPGVTVRSSSAGRTLALARALARESLPGDLICLWGELGAGKTVVAKGFGLGLGIEDVIVSPTFVLMAEYRARLPLFHIDLYRLADADEALSGGLLDERQASGVTLVEWPERLGIALPAERLDIRIAGSGDATRSIIVTPADPHFDRYASAAARWERGSIDLPSAPSDVVAP